MSHLATRLREGTQKSHTAAENTAFMKCFLKGIVETVPFRKLLANLYFVYSTLEEELKRHSQHPIVGKIYFPELNRQQNLEQDLEFYYGDNWRSEIVPLKAGQVYVDRLKEISDSQPELLIAHSYTRYLGDLSGGQALKHIVRSALDLPSDRGTTFYEFDQFPTVEAKRDFKEKYRQALDSLEVDEETVERIVEEANYAFTLNRNVVDELEADVRAVLDPHVFELLTKQDRAGSTERHHSHAA
ncbi:heme oxygenase (biliverdin-producing) [Pseudanabaena sp. FACHB-1998]|uniref:biliverdin-producing heme oxygenase n=1 Tax=Pseudanabaena sp. FACHB-1998 TaxID=2692858 RepID=UPI0016802CCA|nr:heme oxygenase (biliverdin-producing) [Pseudanabaena sp. FACHB-1998]MBD2176020.1 heme oxygenase (biliverdin-producing) [Pseudanabaena sp. FACHB-1998]